VVPCGRRGVTQRAAGEIAGSSIGLVGSESYRCDGGRSSLVNWCGVEPATTGCALCGQAPDRAELAHVVRDKTICEACRRAVAGLEPRAVLPYADADSGRRRGWVWPAVVAAVVAMLLVSLLWTAQRAAVNRARAEQMRAIAAEQQARAAAAAVRAKLAATRPAE
jgi:hypothetical protein